MPLAGCRLAAAKDERADCADVWPTRIFHTTSSEEWFSLGNVISYYDTSVLKGTLERLVDFDRINKAKDVRLSVGAVNVRTGEFSYFDSANMRIGAEHVMASGALPPAFPSVEIDGEHYWDGGFTQTHRLNTCLTIHHAAAA